MPRERAVPCRGATLQESIRGSHKTWADDGYCDRCRQLNAQVRYKLAAGDGFLSAASGSRGTSPVPAPLSPALREVVAGSGDRPPSVGRTRSVPATFPVVVLEGRTASRGDGSSMTRRALKALERVNKSVAQESEQFTSTAPAPAGLLSRHQ